MKILELTNFSAGICGVFSRVREEAIRLNKNHEVQIFSSNLTKGSNKIAPKQDSINGVKILRFPAKKLGGESFMHWNFRKAALDFNPDIIIAHSYRHLHTLQALSLAKKLNAKIFLVTHAPFTEGIRSKTQFLAVSLFDKIIGPLSINKFNKILTITNWELSYLENLRVKSSKIVYSPNGIPELFFSQKKEKEEVKILFLGRVAPIKDLGTLIKSLQHVKSIKLEIVGPVEEHYKKSLQNLITSLKIENRVKFSKPVFETKAKIKKIDQAKIFVLPSKTESMPQSLIEAMAREKIVIASDNKGAKELIKHGKNGFLFKIGNVKDLANKIETALKARPKIKENAKKSVEKFSWSEVIKKIESTLQ